MLDRTTTIATFDWRDAHKLRMIARFGARNAALIQKRMDQHNAARALEAQANSNWLARAWTTPDVACALGVYDRAPEAQWNWAVSKSGLSSRGTRRKR